MIRSGRRVPAWREVWVAVCLCLVVARFAGAQSPQATACAAPVLTLSEAARLLRVDSALLEQSARNGDVPARRIGALWRFSCATLLAWLGNSESEANAGRALAVATAGRMQPLPVTSLTGIVATGTAGQQAGVALDSGPSSADDGQQSTIGEASEERTAEDVFLRGQRLLLGPGDVVVDVGQFFVRRDELRLTTAGGAPALATLDQRALTTLLVGRVGVFHETEVFAATSYSSQRSRQFIDRTTLATSNQSGFGATALGIRCTFLRERVGRPDVVVTFSGRIPTDTVPAAAGAGVVLIKSLDPVVLFASVNVVHAFRQMSGELATRFRSADSVDLAFGYGLGLNDRVAISMAVSGSFARTTTPDGQTFRSPSSFGARFGVTTSIARGLYLEPAVTFGLTGPGDTVSFGITLPYTF